MVAFNTTSSIPFGWVNLRRGVLENETRSTCTACAGTLVLELSLLSFVSGDAVYFVASHRALLRLWTLRDSVTNLVGNSLDGGTLRWLNRNSGVGAGIDSFYEYLLKSYVMTGHTPYWTMFQVAYRSATRYLRRGPWYIESSMKTGRATHYHFNSLQAFWPSLQIEIGDVPLSLSSIDSFFSLWARFGGLPERFLLNSKQPHSAEKGYPLRPELIESVYYAMKWAPAHSPDRAYFRWIALEMLLDVESRCKTEHGFTILDDVERGDRGDYMPSYFVAETLKYLFLLFDTESVLSDKAMAQKFIFSTEGHVLPFYHGLRRFVDAALRTEDGDGDHHDDHGDDRQEATASITNRSRPHRHGHGQALRRLFGHELFDEMDAADREHTEYAQPPRPRRPRRWDTLWPSTASRRSIIGSKGIESIFVPQSAQSAVCPAEPFAVYRAMHRVEGGGDELLSAQSQGPQCPMGSLQPVQFSLNAMPSLNRWTLR